MRIAHVFGLPARDAHQVSVATGDAAASADGGLGNQALCQRMLCDVCASRPGRVAPRHFRTHERASHRRRLGSRRSSMGQSRGRSWFVRLLAHGHSRVVGCPEHGAPRPTRTRLDGRCVDPVDAGAGDAGRCADRSRRRGSARRGAVHVIIRLGRGPYPAPGAAGGEPRLQGPRSGRQHRLRLARLRGAARRTGAAEPAAVGTAGAHEGRGRGARACARVRCEPSAVADPPPLPSRTCLRSSGHCGRRAWCCSSGPSTATPPSCASCTTCWSTRSRCGALRCAQSNRPPTTHPHSCARSSTSGRWTSNLCWSVPCARPRAVRARGAALAGRESRGGASSLTSHSHACTSLCGLRRRAF